MFPNISKRNQKLVEKVKYNQIVEITTFLFSQIPALRIRRPQVRILPGVPIKTKGYSENAVTLFSLCEALCEKNF